VNQLNQDSAIAVVGMGCRFPQAPGIDELWEALLANTDAVVPVPEDRFPIASYFDPAPGTPGRTVSRHGGFLEDPFSFDAAFFGISPAEARRMDPQQRLLLPVVWEALEAAGIPPASLAGSRAGVFIGQATGEYSLPVDLRSHDIKDATGSHVRAMTPGRLSYVLDLRGPSLVIDTACSSSLVAVHTARLSLLSGESDLAIAGGVNVILSPQDSIAYSQAAMLSPGGRCRFGDAGADGFVRSEGVGAVVLKRLGDAVRDGDPVLACLLGSAVTNDGRGSGLLLHPAVSGQVDMLQEACRSAGISPHQLDYLEAHGTGTSVGDGVELRAMAEANAGRPAGRPLLTGSVKSNIGHAEAAAGIAGLIKTVLIARYRTVPASLHMETPHPLLTEGAPAVRLVTENQPLPTGGAGALLGVSSFGLSGTNAHVVVGEYLPPQPGGRPDRPEPAADRPTRLLVLSARSEYSLTGQALAFADFLGPEGPGHDQPLRDICAAAAVQRDAHPHRLWAVGSSHEDLAAALRALAVGEPTPDGGLGEAGFGTARRNVFVFPGQGSQWLGMGRSLLRSSATFRDTLTACDLAVREETGWSVIDLLTSPGEDFPEEVEKVQPTLWAVTVALAATWREMGVEPAAVIGHSMGEVAAACVTGALTVPDAAAVICRRSRLMQRLAGRGAMLAAEVSVNEAERLAAAHDGRVCVAAENSPTATVLAGDIAVLRDIRHELEDREIHSRLVKVNVASHSPLMDPLREDLLAALDDLAPTRSDIPMISTVTCAPTPGQELTAGYWMDNLRLPVRFAESLRTAAKEAASVFIEISPHPVLRTAMEETLESFGAVPAVVSSGRRQYDEHIELARAVGQVFAHGGQVDWNRWSAAPGRRMALPRYVWDEQYLRRPPAPALPAAPVEHTRDVRLGRDVLGVALHGLAPVPPTALLLAVLDTARTVPGGPALVLEEARLAEDFIDLAAQDGVILRSRLVEGPQATCTATVEAVSGAATTVCLDARLRRRAPAPPHGTREEVDGALTRCRQYLSAADFLRLSEARGYRIDTSFQAVRQLWRRDGEAVARLRLVDAPRQALWETCLQPLLAAFPGSTPATSTYLPTAFGHVQLFDELTEEFWSRVVFRPGKAGQGALADVVVSDPEGRTLAEFHTVHLRFRAGPESGTSARRRSAPRRPKLPTTAGIRDVPRALRSTFAGLTGLRGQVGGTTSTPPWSAPAVPLTAPACASVTAAAPGSAHHFLTRQAAVLLDTSLSRINLRRPLRDYGLDSLTATQLSRWLLAEHGADVPVRRLLGSESIESVIQKIRT